MAAAGAPAAGEDGGGILHSLTARGESLAAFDGRCIPAGCVAPRSNTPGILGRRALPAGRLARLGATPDFHHGLLSSPPRRTRRTRRKSPVLNSFEPPILRVPRGGEVSLNAL